MTVVNEYYVVPDEHEEQPPVPPAWGGDDYLSEELVATLAYLEEYDSSAGTSITETANHFKLKQGTANYRLRKLLSKGKVHMLSPGVYRLGPGEPLAVKSKSRKPKVNPDRKPKVNPDEIEVLRIYRHKGTKLSVSVDEHGQAKMPKINLTAVELRALALISARIAEMNALLGLGN